MIILKLYNIFVMTKNSAVVSLVLLAQTVEVI